MKKLLLLLFIVGCSDDVTEYSILGKWIVTESTNSIQSENFDGCNFYYSIDTYFDITDDNFIWISEQIGMDENGNPTTNWFSGWYFNYLDNSPNLIISIDSSFNSTNFQREYNFTYEVNETELKLQHISMIQDGDTTTCNSYLTATSISEVPEISP